MTDELIDEEFDEVTNQEQQQFTREYKIEQATSLADWVRDDEDAVKLFDEIENYYKGYNK